MDKETGEIYLRARLYNSVTGRFTSEDSVRSATYTLPNKRKVDDPLSLNLYTYCHNNPVMFTDPTGHSVEQVLGGSLSICLGYAAMTAGLAALTVATGGLALVVASRAVVAGGGLITYGAFEASEGITGQNILKGMQGEQAYYDTMGALSIVAPAAGAYSAQYYQMYAPISVATVAQKYVGTRDLKADFNKGKALEDHFIRHAGDFGLETPEQYHNAANNFLMKNPTKTTYAFTSDSGWYYRYDSATNEFGMINKYGGISTYFKPKDGYAYWQKQVINHRPR